ncbi:hypothetical protein CR513_39840, partial [Mucuna pruriens]
MGTEWQSRIKQGYPIQEKAPNGSCLKGQWRRAFERMHDNLLRILEIETQSEALEVLVQYYPPLAPTLEEYERLLGLPLVELAQYFHQDQSPSWTTIAGLLRVVYLEQRLCQLQEDEEWPAVMNALGLLLYAILLFPRMEDYVDLTAMEVFVAKKDRGENPTTAVLANTYYTLSHCGEQKGGTLRCCTPLLYLWLTSHFFHCKNKTTFPIEDFKWSWIRPMTKEAWVRKLDEASERTVRWYPPWNEREHMIIKCGGYLNVPLLGTQGAINYNPELVVRQAGYPMIRPP